MKKELSLEQMPSALSQSNEMLENIERIVLKLLNSQQGNEQKQWFSLNEVINYDPAKRTKPTWYSMVSRGDVPYHKSGNRLMFLKSEIDDWLKSGKRKSNAEIEAEAHTYLSNNKRKGHHAK